MTTQHEDLPLQLARTKHFSLGVPRAFTVSPDGDRVLFLRTASGRSTTGCLWLYEDGEERLLADPRGLGDGGEVPAAERSAGSGHARRPAGSSRTPPTRPYA